MSNALTLEEFASYMDSTILAPDACAAQIEKLCEEAKEYGFAAVCVNPRWIKFSRELLRETPVKVCSVIGFPFGADISLSKANLAKDAIDAGAQEIDMVIDLAAAIEGDNEYLTNDICIVLEACRKSGEKIVLKVIIEAAILSDQQIENVCLIASSLGIDFVKTSTGLHKAGGANVADVALMARAAENCKVKAAGGIRNMADTLAMVKAGASRIGTSNATAILQEYKLSLLEQ